MSDPIRVLHVEDDSDFADLVETCLTRESDRIEVTTAPTAEAGLESLQTEDVDCIVSDYDMPGLTGVEFLTQVRDTFPDLPFVLFTGKGSETVASDAISKGVSDYLQKSTGTDQFAILGNRIENLVAGYWAKREAETQTDRIRSIFQRVSDAFVAVDPDWRYTEVNPHAEELLRHPATDLLGRRVWAVFPALRDTAIGDALCAAMDRGETPHVEDYFDPLDAWFEVRPFPLEEGISVYFRDITDRIEREHELKSERNRLRVLFDRLPDPVVEYDFVDAKPIIRRVNSAFERAFGVAADDAIGTSLDEVVIPQGYEDEAVQLNQRVLVGDRLDQRVVRQTVDGTRTFLLRNAPIEAANGVRGFSIYIDLESRTARSAP